MRLITCAVATIVLWLVTLPAAFAHDDVVGTSPNSGGQMTQLPAEVRVEFAEPPTFGIGSVTGPAGQVLRAGEVQVDGTELIIPVRPNSGLGTYEVEFRATSADGHSIAEAFTFEVIQQVASPSTPSAPSPEVTSKVDAAADADSPAPKGGGPGTWLWAGLVGGAGIAVSVLLRRAASRPRNAR